MSRPVDPTLRERLLEAATHEFATRGFGVSTMTGIGEQAGVTKGGVYFHFRGKEELFFAAVDHWRRSLRESLAAAAEAPVESSADRLRAVLVAYLTFHFDQSDAARLLRVLGGELRDRFTAQLREDARQEHRALRAQVRELMTRGARDGSLFTEDPVFAAFLLASSVHGAIEQWLTSPEDAQAFCHAGDLAEALVLPYATGASLPEESAPEEGRDLMPPF